MSNRIVVFAKNTLECSGPHGKPPLIAVAYNEPGYHPIYSHADPAHLNEQLGVSAEVVDAFICGSMFGWTTPAAKPARDWHFAKFGTIQPATV